MDTIVASGPVIVIDGKLLVNRDGKDPFYKIPGGKCEFGEDYASACVREFREETGLECVVGEKLSTMITQKPGDDSVMVELHHYLASLSSPLPSVPYEFNGHRMELLAISRLREYDVAPNILFLLDKGELR